jgi:hypothetical protein
MFDKIYNSMSVAVSPNSLQIRSVYDELRDFVKCISNGLLDDEELDDLKYFTKDLSSDIKLLYLFVKSEPKAMKLSGGKEKQLRYDTARKMGTKFIVIYHYSEDSGNDKESIERLLSEAKYIVNTVYSPSFNNLNTKELFENFDERTAEDKLLMLAPYIIVCKLFETFDLSVVKGGEFVLQEALNPDNIKVINRVIKGIISEQPSLETLINLNGFMLLCN